MEYRYVRALGGRQSGDNCICGFKLRLGCDGPADEDIFLICNGPVRHGRQATKEEKRAFHSPQIQALIGVFCNPPTQEEMARRHRAGKRNSKNGLK